MNFECPISNFHVIIRPLASGSVFVIQCHLLKDPPPSGANMGRRNFNKQNRSVGAVHAASCVPNGTHYSFSQFSTDILLLTEHF